MTLEEASRWQPDQEPHTHVPPHAYRRRQFNTDPRVTESVAANAAKQSEDKARWQEAVDQARQRGLTDDNEKKTSSSQRVQRSSNSRRNPFKHAEVLLRETSLPFNEIADITGLDVYKIIGMKLKLRKVL